MIRGDRDGHPSVQRLLVGNQRILLSALLVYNAESVPQPGFSFGANAR
jgi:hypothetical protein